MSLIKQLWLAIIFIVTLASTGCFILSMLSSKHYLEEQLQTKNNDNVTSLALSMSQMKKDLVTLDLLLSAQFDSGHYRHIGLIDPTGNLISERIIANTQTKAPKWFIKLIPIKVQPGVADVQNGWAQYGSLTLESDVNFAYDKLWDVTLLIAIWTFLIALLACYAGGIILQKILRPLDDVVKQAKALGEGRFITIDEPKTLEFKAVVHEINLLSNRIKHTVINESARLEELRYKINYDDVTGLMNHDYFVNSMEADLNRHEYNEGALVIFRLSNLAQLDEAMGYPQANALLRKIGGALESNCKEDLSLISGRLSGTEFAVFCKVSTDEFALAKRLKDSVTEAAEIKETGLTALFLVATTKTGKVEKADSLFKALDLTLNISSSSEENYLRIINASNIVVTDNDYLVKWKTSLSDALLNKRIKLEHFPVMTPEGILIHNESPVRLQFEKNGKWYCAGEFVHWAIQLNLITAIDELVLETAIKLLTQGAQPLCLNVSAYSMCDPKYAQKAATLVQQHLQRPEYLSIEVPEVAVFEHLNEFKQFCSVLKAAGCHVGMEHVGLRISRLGELHDIGLTYIKFDASIVRNIDTHENNKSLLRGLCMVVHSIGVQAIAEGVNSKEEIEALKEIGIDGLTGPSIKFDQVT